MSVTIDISVESPLWDELPGAAQTARGAIEAALADHGSAEVELSVVLAEDARIRELNRTWLGKDKPTNVLSFPAAESAGGKLRFLGDIVLAFETIKREADAERKSLEHHVAHLAVHGTLHLLGYDHGSDSDAESMEDRERSILGRLGISDPYAPVESKRTEPA